MASLKRLINRQRNANRTYRRIKMRNHLNADALYSRIREDFDKVSDHRAANAKISLSDALISGLAMFCLKDPSLLAFERRIEEEPDSLHKVFGLQNIPCDSQMRTILDLVSVRDIRRPFKRVFAQLQRGKALEKMVFSMAIISWRWMVPASTPLKKSVLPIAKVSGNVTVKSNTINRCSPVP